MKEPEIPGVANHQDYTARNAHGAACSGGWRIKALESRHPNRHDPPSPSSWIDPDGFWFSTIH